MNFTEFLKYVKVSRPTNRKAIRITLFPYQRRLIKDYKKYDRVIGLKFRNGGFTTINLIFGLYRSMFKKETVSFISTTSTCSEYAKGIINRIISNFPQELTELVKNNNNKKIEFIEGNYYFNSGYEQIQNTDWIFIDEAGFMPLNKILYPVLNTNKKLIIFSTYPNSEDNWFLKLYRESKDFYKFESNYKERFNEKEIEKFKNSLPKEIFAKEFECHL